MKFLLKALLLFALIIAGKLVKQQALVPMSVAKHTASEGQSQKSAATSFFTRQVSTPVAEPLISNHLWHATAVKADNTSSFE